MGELSKLLTFMFREDRSEILQKYNDMLDNADDEQAMLESFGSPTRLAVAISREYSRDERKLSVKADSKDADADTGAVKAVIPEAAPKAEKFKVTPVKAAQPEVEEHDYVDVIEEIRREKAAEEGIEYKPIFFKEEPKPEEPEEAEEALEPEAEEPEENTDDIEVEVYEEEPEAETAEEAVEPEQADEVTDSEAPEAEAADSDDESDEDIVVEVYEETPEGSEAEEAEAEPAADEEKTVVEGEETETESVDLEATVVEGAEPTELPEEPVKAEQPEQVEVIDLDGETKEELAPEKKTVTKTRVFALILYLIISIPVGLVVLVAMLCLELAVLACGVAAIAAGVELTKFTFSGMPVLADTFLSLGVTVAVFAIGLFVAWLGLWLILRSVPGLIRGIVKLGKKLCTKEVEIDG